MTEIKWKLDSTYIQQVEAALQTQGYRLGRRLGGRYAREVFDVTCHRNALRARA